MGRKQSIKVLHMHELRVDFIYHGFSEVFFKHSLVFLSEPSDSVEDRLDRRGACELHDPIILLICGEDFKSIPHNEQDIGQIQLQSLVNFLGKSKQDLFKPLVTLPAQLFILLNRLFLLVDERFLFFADQTLAGTFKPKMYFRVDHALNLLWSVDLHLRCKL